MDMSKNKIIGNAHNMTSWTTLCLCITLVDIYAKGKKMKVKLSLEGDAIFFLEMYMIS